MSRPLADLLRELRREQGASLRAAARDLGVDPAHLSRLERGEKPPSQELLARASNYYTGGAAATTVGGMLRGDIPADIKQLLLDHPGLIERLRTEYGSR